MSSGFAIGLFSIRGREAKSSDVAETRASDGRGEPDRKLVPARDAAAGDHHAVPDAQGWHDESGERSQKA
jgi:hypothetical protein